MGLQDRYLVCRRHGMHNNCLLLRLYTNPCVKIWNLLEDGNLFNPVKDGHFNDELHFAQMISLMGPPPKEFLERSNRCRKYWDAEGERLTCHVNTRLSLLADR